MSTCYGDPVLDFDLNFLRPTPSSTVAISKIDKQRKAILIVKKKTIATNSLIKKYYAKRDALEQAEKSLLAAKEECKQICIDYRKSVDTCSSLENDILQLRANNKDLESKYSNLESQYQAVHSHANQLQILVKEHEILIESLKIETKLNKTNDKDNMKILQPLQKENNMLIKHICIARDIILGKIKCKERHKKIFKKYGKYKGKEKDDCIFSDGDNDDYASEEIPFSPFSEEYIEDAELLKGNKTSTMNDNILDSIPDPNMISSSTAECNDVTSMDTGRGSSMALSVSDKSYQSPDYFISDSPLSDEAELDKVKIKLVDSATSPVPFMTTVNVCTSPIIFENNLSQNNHMVDRALSPIVLPAEAEDDVCVPCAGEDVSLSMDVNSISESSKADENVIDCVKTQKERECLELNNSNNISNENSNDCEIEMILSTMRLHNELITPIPATPAKSCSLRDSIHRTPNKSQELSPKVACQEAVIAREENKKLQASILELAKELANIKNMVINRPIPMQNYEDEIINHELSRENRINQATSFVQPPPKDIITFDKTNDKSVMTNEKLSLQSKRKSLDLNALSLSNNEQLHSIPEVEENNRDTSTPCCEKIPASINGNTKDLANENETNLRPLEMLTNNKLVCEQVTASINEMAVDLPVNEENEITLGTLNTSIDAESVAKDDHSKLVKKRKKKITKLGKLKEKMLPKYKIRRDHLPLKRKSIKLRQLANLNQKKRITAEDSSATLNSKNVYEKAVKVMNELKRKKSIYAENDFERMNKKDLPESNHIDDATCTPNENMENTCNLVSKMAHPIQISQIITRRRSITQKTEDSRLDPPVTNSFKSTGLDDNHNQAEQSKSPEVKKHLKRKSEHFTSESPSKRVLRSSNLDNSKIKDSKMILQRCEPLIIDTELTSIENTLLNCNVSPKNRKTQLRNKVGSSSSESILKIQESAQQQEKTDSQDMSGHQVNHLTSLEGKVSQIQKVKPNGLTGNRRKSSKDTISPEVSPKKTESQEKCDIPSMINNRRKSARLLSYTEISPKTPDYQERNNNQDLISHRRKSVRDALSPVLSPKAVEIRKGNDIKSCTTSRRKSIKDISSPPVSPKMPHINERNELLCIQNVSSYRRKSLKDVASLEVSPKTPKSPEINGNRLIISTRRNSLREISSPLVSPKSPQRQESSDELKVVVGNRKNTVKDTLILQVSPKSANYQESHINCNKKRKVDMGCPEISSNKLEENSYSECLTNNPKESTLCQMIEKYGIKSVKYRVKKIADTVINSAAKKIEDGITKIKELPAKEAEEAMNKLIIDIQDLDIKHFLAGLTKYLKDPNRKVELYNKVVATSAPPLTKSEQILLYIITKLKMCWSSVDIVDKILSCIEFTLFSLNRTPQMDVIESMSHFYAALCRYFKMKTRLRLFVLDAMYCIQFKAVLLIRQCIEVWSHIIPLAHSRSAQIPLVTCLVYLLHFYKCDDKFNRVQEIRNTLCRKYFYKLTEWNETKILELFRNSIKSLRGTPTETKMLRLALIILAKRHGPRWCQNHIIKNLLQPMIEKQNNSELVKAFCLSMLGPLLKPYPADMKVHCEIVMNQLITMLQGNPSPKIAEAVVTSLIYINRHNQFRVIQALVIWKSPNVSSELEVMLKEFVKAKPLKVWKITLSKAVQ